MNDCSPISIWMMEFRRGLRYASWNARRIHEEMKTHLLEAADAFEREGLSRKEAEERAIERFGSPEVVAAAFGNEIGPILSPRIGRWSALIGALLAVPGVLFLVSNVLKFELGRGTLYDGTFGTIFALGFGELNLAVNAVIVGGSILALGFVGLSSIGIGMRRNGDAIEGGLSFRFTKAALVVMLVSLVVLGSIAAYLLLENLPCWYGGRVEC